MAHLGGVVIRPGSGRRISGFGDVVLATGGNLPLGDGWPVEIGIQAQAKLPTGRSSLSSGKMDAGFDVEISKSLGPVSPFLVVGRRFYGDSAELELNDGWATSIGAAVTHRKSTFIISYDWEQSAVSLPDSRDLFLVASTAFGRDWTLTLLGSKGLSAGSADHMLGFALARSFRRGARASVRN